MILVTGATGRVGYHVLEALADAGADTTAMVRVEAKAANLPGAPAHVVASFDDPPPAEVLRGFDRVFLLSPADEEQADATGLPATYLAPSPYMENLLAAAETIREDGIITAPAGHGRVGFVAATDVAAVAAKVLTSDDHHGETYVLTGPEALGYADVAARISAVFARQVDYKSQPAEQLRKLLLASGLSRWNADGTVELFEWIRHGGAATVTADVRKVTDAGPRPLQDWLEESRGSFLGPPSDLPPTAF